MECGYSGCYCTGEDSMTYEEDGATAAKAKYNCLNSWIQSGQIRSLCYENYRVQIDMMGHGYLYNLKNSRYEMDNLWEKEEFGKIKLL